MEYVFTFVEGIASFISPCILPMLPIYISYFAEKENQKGSKTAWNSIGFVFGFTVIFVLMAIFANSFGRMIGQYLKQIQIIFGIIIIILGLNYMGVIQLHFLNRTGKTNMDIKDLNFIKSMTFGMLFSISWTPCVGSFLSSALLLIAKEQYLLKGIILILLYSLGLGIPFIISAIFIDQLKSTFHFIKKDYHIITKISGLILIGMGIYMILN